MLLFPKAWKTLHQSKYNRDMQFRTQELLQRGESLPADESSRNHAERSFPDDRASIEFFKRLKERLIDLTNWNHKSGLTAYEIFESSGEQSADKILRAGGFVRITLFGSGKYDWVKIEDIFDSEDELVITVRPTYDPTTKPQQTGKVSHFFISDSTNNFCAFRKGNTVYLYVIGLNEKQNTGHTSGPVETARNAVVANLGYYLGIQKAEWSKFCQSFLYDGEEQTAG